MSDEWNNPSQEPQQPIPPEQPSAPQAPYNGWSNDGSYRFVPPRNQAPQPPTPPAPQPPKKKGNGLLVALAIICALSVVASVAFLGMGLAGVKGTEETSSEASNEQEGDVSDESSEEKKPAISLEVSDWDDNDGGLSNKEIVERNKHSTVVITTYVLSESFNFGESELVEAGGASGIVMSADGYIITNRHCVINESTNKAYDQVNVTTYDGKTYENAKIIGTDESTDLAVIKVDATKLTVAQFGDSTKLAVGDRVVALGNAAGLSWTATFGYVSALARDVYDDTGYAIKCLQVDAAINPGNSGGPLLNNQGLVVGINSAKIAATGYEGLGFSIPISEARVIIDDLCNIGHVKGRVALGISGQSVSSGVYKGFLITAIDKDSSFANTDVKAGDLIVGVDKVTVTSYGELRSELAKHKVGDRVTIKLLRSNRNGRVSSFEVEVTLKEQTATN